MNTREILTINIKNKFYYNNNDNTNYLAIKDLFLQIPSRQICCIVGPSGCGKTTMLNIIAGLDESLNSSVSLSSKKDSLEETPISYMFQTPRLLPWLTVVENVKIVLGDIKNKQNRAEELLSAMGLEKFLKSYPSSLSGGMQRRVALARSFANKPRILILDEPFVSLDEPAANILRKMLLDLWGSEPTTIIFVTHDLREAILLGDRIIFFSKAPATVIKDIKISLSRPRHNSLLIEKERDKILNENKNILNGTL